MRQVNTKLKNEILKLPEKKPMNMWRFATSTLWEYYDKLSREYIRLKEYTVIAIEIRQGYFHRYRSDCEIPILLTSLLT